MSEPLKPCDCGWARTKLSAPDIWYDTPNHKFRAFCPCCPASTAWFATMAEAIAAWNRRAPAALPTREEIARILAPEWFDEVFARSDHHLLDNHPGQHVAMKNAALSKADAILSLLRAKEKGSH